MEITVIDIRSVPIDIIGQQLNNSSIRPRRTDTSVLSYSVADQVRAPVVLCSGSNNKSRQSGKQEEERIRPDETLNRL